MRIGITTGNHVWDQKETISFIGSDPRLLRPINFPAGTPGKGSAIYQTARGKKVLVANIMARLFMDPLDDPFQAADQLLKAHRMGGNVDAILIDFHGEATSEKMAMGHFLDGKVSLVGRHAHPCPDGGSHDPQPRHGVSDRCRHVRRL